MEMAILTLMTLVRLFCCYPPKVAIIRQFAATFFASLGAGCINGINLPVDGSRTACL